MAKENTWEHPLVRVGFLFEKEGTHCCSIMKTAKISRERAYDQEWLLDEAEARYDHLDLLSDACTFASHGINSVNLSAGYLHEHTEDELVALRSVRETIKLILTALDMLGSQNLYFHGLSIEECHV